MVVSAVSFITSAWDEAGCVAGEYTSSGPCGIEIVAAEWLVVIGLFLLIIGCIVLYRGIRRPVGEDAADGWRVGQAVVVMICGVLMSLMIPRYRCPPGTTLSPVFRFCVNQDVVYAAPSPGLPWKFAAFGMGIVIGVVLIRWRSVPIWLATVVVVAASVGTALFITWRTTGIPGVHGYAPALVLVTTRLLTPSRLRRGARPVRHRSRPA
jgi:hypothetical protein